MDGFDNFTNSVDNKSITLTLPGAPNDILALLEAADPGYEIDDKAVLRLVFLGTIGVIAGYFESDGETPVPDSSNPIFGGDTYKLTKEEFGTNLLLDAGASVKFRVTQLKPENLFL